MKIVALSSSLLTERILHYSSFASEVQSKIDLDIWTTSYREEGGGEDFPAVFPFKEFPHNFLKRLNDYAWDYKLRAPSRFGDIRKIRHNDTASYFRWLKLPARMLALMNLQSALEDNIENILLSYDRSPEGYNRLYKSKPDIVLTTGSFRYEEPAIAAHAIRMGIPTIAFITSWDNPSTKNRMVFKYDGYIVWSKMMKEHLHHFFPYTRKVPVYITGAPQYDIFFQERFHESREMFCKRYKLESSRPYILYAMGSPNLFNELPAIINITENISGGILNNVQLLVRPHPLFDPVSGLKITERRQNEDQIKDWVNSFRHAAVVVNLSSTSTIDAVMLGKPVVNLNFDPSNQRDQLVKEINHTWPHFKPVTESGGVALVNTPDEMIKAINLYLDNPELHKEQRSHLAEMVCGFTDGGCGERMALALSHCLTQRVEAAGLHSIS